MPANKGNLTPHKEKPGNGFANAASKKKKRCTVKHKKHCKQYLVSEPKRNVNSLRVRHGHVAIQSSAIRASSVRDVSYLGIRIEQLL